MPTKAQRRRRRQRASTVIAVLLTIIIIALSIYVVRWYAERARIRQEESRVRQMYARSTQGPMLIYKSHVPTQAPQPTEAPAAPDAPTQTPQSTEAPAATDAPTPVAALTVIPTAVPATTAVGAAFPNWDMPIAPDEPLPTPDDETMVFAMPTPPPVQGSFAELLAANPDTVAYLDIPDTLALPVLQRPNDNTYYLDHTFEGQVADEGALFMDGMNRLVPEDDCLIVYGHNMKNNTMFGRLEAFEKLSYLKAHGVIHFDTIYENRAYVPFAAFTASVDARNSRFFDVRRFIFDPDDFDAFTGELKQRSMFRLPVDVTYGDHLLLLVTCDYTRNSGRFILALRQARADETEDGLRAMLAQSTAR